MQTLDSKLPANPVPDLRIVLVGTQHPGNIGAAARALKTMGLSKLVLVAPEHGCFKDKRLHDEAWRRAAGAEDVLENAWHCATLAESLADCTFALGTTARGRKIQLHEHDPREAAQALLQRAAEGPVALVFGRERTGLFNEELQLCHGAVQIPANPDYSSLNLAAAVQVLAYEVRMAWRAGQVIARGEHDEPKASQAQLEGFFAQLGETLDDIDFHKGRNPDSAMRKLRRLFLRNSLTDKEVKLLRGVLSDAQRMVKLARRE